MRGTVLVVDDDRDVRHALARLLRAEGLRVVEAEDGATALKLFRDDPPDLVLLDIVMPEVDGIEVCRQLKSDPEHRLVPVVLLTGMGTDNDRIYGIDIGADDFLSKPIEAGELLVRIRSLLRIKQYTDELERAESVVLALARAIEARDPYTEGHCRRLAEYSTRLAERLGFAPHDMDALRIAAVVHDIGKVVVPDSVLLKNGRLTEEEWVLMRSHPVKGEEICRGLRSFRHVLPIIRHHHERMDGSGYPDGLQGDEIPLGARVLQVVDVYDALTTARPYKSAMEPSEAFEVLRSEVGKGWWDSEITEVFVSMMEKIPAGSSSPAAV